MEFYKINAKTINELLIEQIEETLDVNIIIKMGIF